MSFLQIPIGTYPNTFLGYESSISMNASLGVQNTAFGYRTLRNNTTGDSNAAFGNDAMLSGITSKDNVAIGDGALRDATDPTNNTAVGSGAMLFTLSGSSNNVAIGTLAGSSAAANLRFNTFVGAYSGSFSSGQYNSFFGFRSGELITGSKNTIIGRFDGNQFGLDIRTLSNHIVLSDGDGNPRLWINNTGAVNIPGGLALTGSLSITGGTVTGNNPVLSATQTWNNAAVTFTGWQLNVTDTASAAASLLMDLQVGGVSRLQLTKDGNLGLGVGPSAWFSTRRVIQIGQSGSLAASTNSQVLDLGSNALLDSAGNFKYIATGFASYYRQFDSVHSWHVAPSGTAGNAISFTQAMTLNASGNLLLGTTSGPAGQRLRIAGGDVGLEGQYLYMVDANANIQLGATQNSIISNIDSTNTLSISRTGASSIITFSTAGSERARIPAAGGMVVGTAALATSATNGFLYVPTCAGTPTGTPTTYTGTAPIVVDTTNNKLYFYSGGQWRDAGP